MYTVQQFAGFFIFRMTETNTSGQQVSVDNNIAPQKTPENAVNGFDNAANTRLGRELAEANRKLAEIKQADELAAKAKADAEHQKKLQQARDFEQKEGLYIEEIARYKTIIDDKDSTIAELSRYKSEAEKYQSLQEIEVDAKLQRLKTTNPSKYDRVEKLVSGKSAVEKLELLSVLVEDTNPTTTGKVGRENPAPTGGMASLRHRYSGK